MNSGLSGAKSNRIIPKYESVPFWIPNKISFSSPVYTTEMSWKMHEETGREACFSRRPCSWPNWWIKREVPY
jgi:hypothetical protein